MEVEKPFPTVCLTCRPLGFVNLIGTLIVWLDLYHSLTEFTFFVGVLYVEVRIIIVILVVLGAHIGNVNLFGTPVRYLGRAITIQHESPLPHATIGNLVSVTQVLGFVLGIIPASDGSVLHNTSSSASQYSSSSGVSSDIGLNHFSWSLTSR